jgi:hypothetical protein
MYVVIRMMPSTCVAELLWLHVKAPSMGIEGIVSHLTDDSDRPQAALSSARRSPENGTEANTDTAPRRCETLYQALSRAMSTAQQNSLAAVNLRVTDG